MNPHNTLTPEMEARIRASINRVFSSTLGTESHERTVLLSEIDRLRDVVDAKAGRAEGYLAGGTRYKVSHDSSPTSVIRGLPAYLNGRWVALVAAEDNCHLLRAVAPMAALTAEQIEAEVKRRFQSSAELGFAAGARWAAEKLGGAA